MPGIAGIISKIPSEKRKKDLRLMLDCMMHEPFYTSGIYANNQLSFYAGWVCHRDSFSDCLPIFNENHDLTLFFSGENFADKEVTDRLKGGGHEFSPSNAGYLIHLYEDDGENFFQRLNGWFSGVLIDFRKEEITLFNDRFGMQKVYYYENEDAFYFASEAKSLLKVSPELRRIDHRGLGEFFACGCVLENRTLFSDIRLLPGGSAWVFHYTGRLEKKYYFTPDIWENQPVLEKEKFYKKLRKTFRNILPRYFYPRDSMGMSLTGGLDSRMILSNVDILPGGLPFYTFGGMYRDCFDVLVSRRVAGACLQPHTTLRLDREFLADFPRMAEKTVYITDGCHDVCGTHSIYLNKLAREIAPIRMTGAFGSEVLRSATGLKAVPPDEKLFQPEFKKYLREAVNTVDAIKGGHRLSALLFKEAPWRINGIVAAEQSQLTYRTPYMDNDLLSLVYQAPAEVLANNEISLRLIKEGNAALFNIMTDMGFGGGSNPLLSMWTQFSHWFMFKAEWYYDTGMPHWLAKFDYTFEPLNPGRLILGRNKFEHYRSWFCREISGYMQEILLDKRTADRPFLNKDFLEEMVTGHMGGKRNYLNAINKTLTVELVHRLLIENI